MGLRRFVFLTLFHRWDRLGRMAFRSLLIERFAVSTQKVLLLFMIRIALAQATGPVLTVVVSERCGSPYATFTQPAYFATNATSAASYSTVSDSTTRSLAITSQAPMLSETSSSFHQSRRLSFTPASLASTSTISSFASNSPPSPSPTTPSTIVAPCVIAIATSITCPASNGTTYTPAGYCIDDSESYVIDCGMDYAGDDWTALAGFSDIESCIVECSHETACVAVAFDTASKICYERNSVAFGNITAKSTFIFAYNLQYVNPAMSSSTVTVEATSTFPSTTTSNSATSTIVCPLDDGMDITTSDDSIWTVLCGRAYNGIVLALQSRTKRQASDYTPSVLECLSQCESRADCEGFTYDNGQCMSYSYINGSRSARLGTISARRLRLGSGSSSISHFSAVNSESALSSLSESTSPSVLSETITSLSLVGIVATSTFSEAVASGTSKTPSPFSSTSFAVASYTNYSAAVTALSNSSTSNLPYSSIPSSYSLAPFRGTTSSFSSTWSYYTTLSNTPSNSSTPPSISALNSSQQAISTSDLNISSSATSLTSISLTSSVIEATSSNVNSTSSTPGTTSSPASISASTTSGSTSFSTSSILSTSISTNGTSTGSLPASLSSYTSSSGWSITSSSFSVSSSANSSSSNSVPTSSTSSTVMSATPTCTGTAEEATCPFGADEVRQASDGSYWLISCGGYLGGSNTYLETVQVTDTNAIGQCVVSCVAWNADLSNVENQCQYGQIENDESSCGLWSEAVYADGKDNGFDDGPSSRNEIIITTNATLIAGACVVPSAAASSSSSANSVVSFSTTAANSSSLSGPTGLSSISSAAVSSSSAISSNSASPTSPSSFSSSTSLSSLFSLSSSISFSSSSSSSSLSSPASSSSVPSPTPPVCPVSNGTTWTDAEGSQFMIFCGYDLFDSNSETATVQPSLQACIEDCDTAFSGQCPGVTWVQSGQSEQYCYYKPVTASPASSVPAVQSAQRINPCYPTSPTCPSGNQTIYEGADGSLFRLNCNLDYPGYDVDQYAGASINTCLNLCDQRGASCGGVTWVPSYGGSAAHPYTCFMKMEALPANAAYQQTYECDTLVRMDSASSLATGTAPVCNSANGKVYEEADGSEFQIQCNTDYAGDILLVANATSLEVCMDRCAYGGSSCAGVSWTPNGNGQSTQPACYLKGDLDGQIIDSFVSHFALRTRAATITPPQNC